MANSKTTSLPIFKHLFQSFLKFDDIFAGGWLVRYILNVEFVHMI